MDDADLVATRPGAVPVTDGFTPHDRYVLIERLGQGGMGTVWAAHDKVLDRTVALKVLHDEYLGAEDQARLVAEARAMARLSHRNVIDVYDVAEKDGRTYLTMELVRGIDLGEWLEQPREWDAIVTVFRAAAAGLAAAHEAGIVHRDVKPANIMVGDDGETRVADFGVAHASVSKPAPDERPTAVTAGMIGTLAYMSPAQLRGEPADARCDQFAFFSSLYEALHGTRPFMGVSVTDQLTTIERGCPPPVRDVPRWLQATIERGLSADPDKRFASMTEVAAALAGPRRRRGRVLAAVLVVAALATVAIALRMRAPAAASCPSTESELAGVWDAELAQRGAAAFAGTQLAYAPTAWTRIARELDRRAAEWGTAATEACHAQDGPRRACLAEQRRLLAAVSTRIVVGPAVAAARADAIFLELPALADCASPAYRPAVSLATLDGAQGDLAAARAGLVVGATAADLASAARARGAARTAADGPLELAASLVHARIQYALGAFDAARAELLAAGALAAQLRAGAVELDAELALVRTWLALARIGDAQTVMTRALQRARTLGDPRRLAETYALAGELSHVRDDDPTALVYLGDAMTTVRDAHLDDTLWALPVITALVHAYLREDRVDDALAASKRVVDLARQLGERHPAYGRALALSGHVNLAFARVDKARTKATGALRILREAHGDEHLDIADVRDLLAGIAVAEADDLAAETELRAALAIRTRLEPTAEATVRTRKALAKVLARLGKTE